MEKIKTLKLETELFDEDLGRLNEDDCFTTESDQENGEMVSAPSTSIYEEEASEITKKEEINMIKEIEKNMERLGQQKELTKSLEVQKEAEMLMEQSEAKATMRNEKEDFEKFEIQLPKDDESLDKLSDLNDLSLDGYKPTSAKSSKSRSVSGSGGLSIINNKNGRRITLSPKYYIEELGSPATIQVALGEDSLIIGEQLGHGYQSYKINPKYRAVYHAELVKEITENFGLDYSERTSYSFDDIKVFQVNSYKALVICIK